MNNSEASKPPVTAQEVDKEVADFVDAILQDEEGSNRVEDHRAREPETAPERAERAAIQALRGLAAQDVQIVSTYDPDQGIEDLERERELAKAALASLKVKQLSEMAGDLGLRRAGSRSELLDRLLRFVGPDEEQIAEMVLRYGEDTLPGRRHATRLVRLSKAFAAEEWLQRLDRFQARYLRTDIAEWFIFNQVRRFADDLVVEGRLRRYDVEAANLLVEDHGTYGFRTVEREDALVLRVRSSQPILRVQARSEHETRAAATAFCFTAGVSRATQLLPPLSLRSHLLTLPHQSLWLLSLAKAIADNPTIGLSYVSSVSFEQARSSVPGAAERPRIESSRFNGRHVLDTQQISGHVAEGHPVSALSFVCNYPASGATHRLSARVAIDRDVVLVSTGFGQSGPDVAGMLHNDIERLASDAVEDWPLPDDDVTGLALQVIERANQADQPEQATMFAPAGSLGPVEAHPVG